MANQKQVKRLLNGGVDEWNQWRDETDNIQIDLVEVDLSSAELRESRFINTNFGEADLSGADLRSVQLDVANFYLALLCGANLSSADISIVNLSDADLNAVNFNETSLFETIFSDTNLRDATNLETCKHTGPGTIDHRTIEKSGMLPIVFLRGCGVPEKLIDYYPSLLNQPISYYSCFISYRHDDKIFARRLHDKRQGRGIRCWLDEHRLLPGDDIYEQVDHGIKIWDKVLLCASESALTSWWVDNEIDSAFKKGQKIRKQRQIKVLSLIPLDLDGYMFGGKWEDEKAGQVKSRLAAGFNAWEHDNAMFEAALEKTVSALQANEAGRELPH